MNVYDSNLSDGTRARLAENLRIERDQIAFEWALRPGDKVIVRWTNCNQFYTGTAEIERVNRVSIRTKLIAPVASVYSDIDGYPVGNVIIVPRIGARTFSVNNCAGRLPVEGVEPEAAEPAPVLPAYVAADYDHARTVIRSLQYDSDVERYALRLIDAMEHNTRPRGG